MDYLFDWIISFVVDDTGMTKIVVDWFGGFVISGICTCEQMRGMRARVERIRDEPVNQHLTSSLRKKQIN